MAQASFQTLINVEVQTELLLQCTISSIQLTPQRPSPCLFMGLSKMPLSASGQTSGTLHAWRLLRDDSLESAEKAGIPLLCEVSSDGKGRSCLLVAVVSEDGRDFRGNLWLLAHVANRCLGRGHFGEAKFQRSTLILIARGRHVLWRSLLS